ncbi:acyl-CoA-binding protein [Sediminibacterium roseum]|uniref:Acyl-CoA-binding protein n=1 Tax=Sediminibacterium roseum TaxID=1978412 RepID=A0ABW9ZSS2_9BACT|nr:acyl-CoA-binding protein [Sediminibacterium roseum]NCI50178.1 acyl-CoA-binding protein [Sediminibacterium roseum]
MDLQQQFEQAVVNSKTLSEKPDNDTLLQLYSLYKQATEGNAGEGPSNAFDFVAKFKHEAWAKLAGTSKESAMQQYVELVARLKG